VYVLAVAAYVLVGGFSFWYGVFVFGRDFVSFRFIMSILLSAGRLILRFILLVATLKYLKKTAPREKVSSQERELSMQPLLLPSDITAGKGKD
jgi:hypothetical protein